MACRPWPGKRAEAEAAWQRFLALKRTQANAARDFVAWHRGRPRFGVWAIEVDHLQVRNRLRRGRAALAPFLLSGYRRQPHVTLFASGFPCDEPTRSGDVSWATVCAQADRIARDGPAPFTLRIGGIISLAGAPCLQVQPEPALFRLRDVLLALGPEDRTVPYEPHLTLGLYAAAYAPQRVRRQLRGLHSSGCDAEIRVSAVSFLTFDTATILGPLRPELRVSLPDL